MKPRILLPLGLLALIWGSSFLLIKFSIAGMTPLQLVLWRLAAGAGVLLVIAALRREPLPLQPRMIGHLTLLGVIANLVPFYLFAWGEQSVTSGMAGVLNGTTPLFTLMIALAALPEEHLSAARVAGLVLGFAGVVLVVAPWQGTGTNALAGQLACLTAAACYGVALVYTRRFVTNRGYPPLALSAVQLSLATLLLAIAAPVVADDPLRLDPLVVASATALGAVGTGLAYLLFYRLISLAGATSASMVTYLIPIVAVILGAVVLSEPVGWNLYVGALIVVTGVMLAEGRLGSRAVEEPVVMQERS